MIIVYFESNCHAEIAAIFPDEATYMDHLELLEKRAEEAGMEVTESVKDWIDIEDVVTALEQFKEN